MNKIEKCRNTQLNRIVIHKNNEEKRIYTNELDIYISDGWETGISDKHRKNNSIKHKGKEPWNKNKQLSNETKQKISNTLKGNIPWNKGTKGLIKSWNKGLTKETDSRIKQAAEKQKANYSDEHRKINAENCKKRKGMKILKDKLKIKLTKEYITKKKNNSFNKSKIEEDLYEQLLIENKNKTIYRQYKDNRYPYYCDFYILEDDLFIELNNHWTHGGRPYNPDDLDCQKQLKEWEEKAKTSKFFENAIQTWTVRDVEKQKCARENNLNYKVIY